MVVNETIPHWWPCNSQRFVPGNRDESGVCMYLMSEKGQIAQKDYIGAKKHLRAKLIVNITIQLSFKCKLFRYQCDCTW